MLKFLRKYQLFILVIGGSLLMVVFLLQPVLRQMHPDPGKRKAATIGPDNAKVTQSELTMADTEAHAVQMVLPPLLQASRVGIGLDPNERNWADHWFLLTKEAEKGGFIGEPGDGERWLPELAGLVAFEQARNEAQQGMITSEQQFQQRIGELTQQLTVGFKNGLPRVAAQQRGMTTTDVERALAHARGIRRMLNFYGNTPRASTQQAVYEAKLALDAVLVDVLPIRAGLLADQQPDPTDEQLQAFFERFRDSKPGEGKFGFGYTLQPRVTLSYLVLDAHAIQRSLTPDRVELHKRWQSDRVTYPGEFADERAKIEQAWRQQRADEIMVAADQAIRAEIRRGMRGINSRDGVYDLPEDWADRRPRWETVAQNIVGDLKTNAGIDLPLPAVKIVTDRYRQAPDLQAISGVGQARFQIGARAFPVSNIPFLLANPSAVPVLRVQVGVPITDQAATDMFGNRYYLTVLGFREEGPAVNIDEVGRDTVVTNYKQVAAYESLAARTDELLATAREDGLEALADELQPPSEDDKPTTPRLQTVNAVRVTRDASTGGYTTPFDKPEFRDAVIGAADGLDPLTPPGDIDPERAFLIVELPATRTLAVAHLIAPRPTTVSEFHQSGPQAIIQASDAWIRDRDTFAEDFPFTLESLKRRWNFKRIAKEGDDEPADAEGETAPGA